ncbi:GNAT family N-acetyltransferase [Lysinibacillus sp. NPDC093190]|uniref:GNAT family N-acetyltransferase n=1 Tax=Lysinibacillus sp. NPDC093190 TaxID=3390575 RepID=UPI003D01F07D
MCNVEIVEFNNELLEGIGSYCFRSKKKSSGYLNENKWLNNRFEEGLKYVQVIDNKKQVGFIEYTEAEYSSRAVHADGYLVIHCLWVSEVGKGYGTRLINICIEDAKKQAKKGVVVISNSKTSWAPSKEIFLKNDFQLIDTAPYDFELLVYQLCNEAEHPYFPNDWEDRLKKFNNLTILRSFQCPYVDIATENIIAGANKLNIPVKLIDFKDREELMELSPTPYGIFSVIYKG